MIDFIFVCTGNTCRSPMAEGLFRKIHPGYDASSMGVEVSIASNANPHSIAVCKNAGIDITSHTATSFDYKEVTEDTIILTMTQAHKDTILRVFPVNAKIITTLKEYVGESGDIIDPYGKPYEVYVECFEELRRLIQKMEISEE